MQSGWLKCIPYLDKREMTLGGADPMIISGTIRIHSRVSKIGQCARNSVTLDERQGGEQLGTKLSWGGNEGPWTAANCGV